MRARITLAVEFGQALAAFVSGGGPGSPAAAIQDRLQDWLDDMGLPAAPDVKFGSAAELRGPGFLDLDIVLDGKRCPFSRWLVA